MAALQWIGLVYVGGALLMAVYQAWRMLFRLDAFDWRYERMEVWVRAILSTLLWPLVIFAKSRGKHGCGAKQDCWIESASPMVRCV
ncbi:hypothetical protein OS187_07380 [Xanthomonadaceae bacterium JHOS43]|nr:hypothetical protein [Xanthomonadaceae bacterium JHOS43]